MKICSKCNAEVEDDYDICWNCQYCFSEDKVIKNIDFELVCPNCNKEIDPNFTFCPHCEYDLKDMNNQIGLNPLKQQQLKCLRCEETMVYKGNFNFHEGTRIGVFGNLFELFTNRESFDLYVCPNCGKVEFYLPKKYLK
jgi:Zn finger protein HypA/HybF involved in hydrogenase expression